PPLSLSFFFPSFFFSLPPSFPLLFSPLPFPLLSSFSLLFFLFFLFLLFFPFSLSPFFLPLPPFSLPSPLFLPPPLPPPS
ncbi:hypothetical protein ACXWRS_11770, partial [Streptococcus pyogenes]